MLEMLETLELQELRWNCTLEMLEMLELRYGAVEAGCEVPGQPVLKWLRARQTRAQAAAQMDCARAPDVADVFPGCTGCGVSLHCVADALGSEARDGHAAHCCDGSVCRVARRRAGDVQGVDALTAGILTCLGFNSSTQVRKT